MLKADLHIHTKEDPKDKNIINYTAKDLIKVMAKKGYDVLAITPHEKPMHINGLKAYAKKKGILLLDGAERFIEKKDVVVLEYNKKLKKLTELKKVQEENGLVIAPHPFYMTHACLMEKLEENIKLFDAIEYSHFYTWFINTPNKKAEEIASKYKKPMVGNSDAHDLFQIGYTYSEIDADLNKDSILEAIRKGKVKVQTRPITTMHFLRIIFKHYTNHLFERTSFKK